MSTYDTDTRHNKTAIQDRQDKEQTQARKNIHQQRNSTTTDKNGQGEPHNKQDTDKHTGTPITPTAKRAESANLVYFRFNGLLDPWIYQYTNKGEKVAQIKEKGANNSIVVFCQ